MENIRTPPADDSELRESMQMLGWIDQLPAIIDEHGAIIVGHRRLKLAAELGIEPVVQTIMFGTGPDADTARMQLAVASNIGAAPMTKADRKRLAERLYTQGLTIEQIAKMIGTGKSTVARDLEQFSHTGKIDRPEKRGRPKAAAAPATPKPKPHEKRRAEEKRAASMVLDDGAPMKKAAAETGIGTVQVVKTAVAREEGRREILADPPVPLDSFSPSVRARLEAWKRQQLKDMRIEFEHRVIDEVRARLQGTLEAFQKRMKEADLVVKARRGVLTRAEYKTLLFCVHTDTHASVSPERLNTAFRTLQRHELALLKETEMPTAAPRLPSLAELMEKRRRVTEERKAKRAAANAT